MDSSNTIIDTATGEFLAVDVVSIRGGFSRLDILGTIAQIGINNQWIAEARGKRGIGMTSESAVAECIMQIMG